MTGTTPYRSVDDFVAAQGALLDGIPIIDRSCPICAHPNLGTPPSRYSLGPWPVKRCVRCALVFITRMPDQQALVADYDWGRSSAIEDQWRRSSRPLVENLHRRSAWRAKLLRRRSLAERVGSMVGSGPVVDLGCGDGAELAKLPRNVEAIGIEISADSAENARQLLRDRPARVISGSSLEGLRCLGDGSCQGAILRSYLEHEAEPRLLLEELSRVLIQGGIALVKVPNFASLNRMVMGRHWCGFRHPDHLNYFTPATLRLAGNMAGFDVEFSLHDVLPTDDNMVATLRNTKVPQSIGDLLPTATPANVDVAMFRTALSPGTGEPASAARLAPDQES